MTAKLLSALKQSIEMYCLVPAGGGCFELVVDGELLWSKLKTHEFPDENEMLKLVKQRVK